MPQQPTITHTRKTFFAAILLATLLAALYLLTYSAHIESGDTLRFMDATTSLVQHGDWLMDESFWLARDYYTPTATAYPLLDLQASLNDGLLNVHLATLLYRLADVLPAVGYVHVVWLLNILICIALSIVLLLWVRALGYPLPVALLTAFLLGTNTLIWAYSKTFFRGPLVALCLLLAALGLYWMRHSWQHHRGRAFASVILALLAFAAALYTKSSSIIFLPAALLLIVPDIPRLTRHPLFKYLSLISLSLITIISAIMAFDPRAIALLYDIWQATPLNRFGFDITYAQVALHTYLFSVGGSVWATSPIILLGIYGIWRLHRDAQARLVWVVALVVFAYAYGHALQTGEHWFGGLSWPPRFMLPTVPFLMLLVAPALDQLIRHRRPRWLIIVFFALMLYSLWVQFNAVALRWVHYAVILPEEANGVLEWSPGLNSLEQLRWVRLPAEWQQVGFDFIWARSGAEWWALLLGGVLGMAAGLLVMLLVGRATSRLWWRLSLLMPILLLVVLYAGLRHFYATDGAYWSDKAALHDALHIIEREATPGDIVLLADPTYHNAILNYSNLSHVRFIALEHQPGEQPSPQQPPRITGHNPLDLMTRSTPLSIDHIAAYRDAIWFLAPNSAFTTWAVRPVERYLAQHYYLLRDVPLSPDDPTVRLLQFALQHPHDPDGFAQADNQTHIEFGNHLQLIGYNLPAGTHYNANDIIPVSLAWQANAPLPQDYVVAWFLADARTHYVIAHGTSGRDQQPVAGFAPTSTWSPGFTVWDNRALRIPDDAAAGDYRLWVRVYGFDASGTLVYLPVSGAETVENGTVALLPTPIIITD